MFKKKLKNTIVNTYFKERKIRKRFPAKAAAADRQQVRRAWKDFFQTFVDNLKTHNAMTAETNYNFTL